MERGSAQWISLSDMMTGLMLVFLLLSVFVMSEIQKKDNDKKQLLVEYTNSKKELYNDIKKAFEEKEEEWQMQIEDDLTIKFTNPDVLFEPNSPQLKENFTNILNDFIPKYLEIINSNKYKNNIKEIRVEGHAGKCTDEEYLVCLNLSQERANNVLITLFKNSSFIDLPKINKTKMKFWLTSNGMSNGKNLDSDGNYVYLSRGELDASVSRRVEFRIVTNSTELIEKILIKEKLHNNQK